VRWWFHRPVLSNGGAAATPMVVCVGLDEMIGSFSKVVLGIRGP
jgi:hypothetical protein